MKTIHDFDGMIIGWIDDKKKRIIIATRKYDVVVPRDYVEEDKEI